MTAVQVAQTSASVPWTAHPEVWALVLGALALGAYAAKVIQPNAVSAGLPAITTKQKAFFGFAVLGMWASSDWPIHDIAEDHLYFVHMFQHLSLSIAVPALFVLATPRWLLELVIAPQSAVWRFLQQGSKPVAAAVAFNALTVLLHFTIVVQASADSGALHFLLHLMVFTAGIFMWMPVIGPIEEWRLPPLGKCIYLFAMSIVPTVPGGWLVFATGVVYQHYDRPDRLWGIDALTDQQAAGLVMKLVGGIFLWAVIVTIFARYVSAEAKKDEQARLARRQQRRIAADTELTFEAVSNEFAKAPAPSEST